MQSPALVLALTIVSTLLLGLLLARILGMGTAKPGGTGGAPKETPVRLPATTGTTREPEEGTRGRSGRAIELERAIPHLRRILDLPQLPPDERVPHPPAAAGSSIEGLSERIEAVAGRLGRRNDIIRLMHRAGDDPRALADVVQRDPLLAGTVLRIINSGFYSLRQRAASVLQAVLLLGVVEVRNLVYRACVSEALEVHGSPVRVQMNDAWKHAFAVSRLAFAMARASCHGRPDEIATGALLHDIGKIVFLLTDARNAGGLYPRSRFSTPALLEREQELFGIAHARCGALVAERWGLPGKTIAMIDHHHAPSYVEPRQLEADPADVALVHVADLAIHLADAIGLEHPQVPAPRAGWIALVGLGLEAAGHRGRAEDEGHAA